MTHWHHVLAAQTGYSFDIFLDLLYVPSGKIIHVLYNLIDRQSALKSYPQQDMVQWPRAVATHRFQCMCKRLLPVECGVASITDLESLAGHPCRHCLDKLPEFMTEKAIAELVGVEDVEWMHADSLRIGRVRWRP